MDEKIKMELLEIAKKITNGISFSDIKDIEVEFEDWDEVSNTKRADITIEYIERNKGWK